MPQIRRIRKRKLRQPAHLEEELPVIDPVAVKAQLNSFLARWTIAAIYILIVASVALVYGQVIEHKFIVLGDKAAVYGNPLVTSGLNSSAVLRVLNPFRIDYLNCGFYSPITVLTHMTDWTLRNQSDDKAASYHHLVNVLLHGLTAIMLFRVLRLITGTIWRSALVAVLFAIHPMQVETVAWVAERGTVLSGLFLVLSLDAYVRYVYRPWSLVRYLTVLVLFILGLLCKPALIGFPFLLLLLDYWPLSRYNRPVSTDAGGHYRQDFPSVFVRMVTEKIPFFAASLVMFAITAHAQSKIENSLDNFSFPVRVNHVLVSSLAYITRVVWPVNLTVFYPQAAESGLFVIVAFAFLLLGVISVTAFFNLKKLPWLFVGWFWFLGMLAPAIGWGAGGLYAGADRFAYLASIGLYLIVIWGGWDLLSLLPKRQWIASLSMIAAISALLVCARIQCSYWNDGESLWTHALNVTKGNYLAYDNLANALVEKGDFEGAIDDYNKALVLHPNYAEAEDDFGIALVQKGKLQDAAEHYQKALGIRPDYPEACLNLGEAFVASGRQDGLDIAISVYQKALQYRPNYADAHYNLGMAYTQEANRYQAGSPQFEQALSAAISEFKQALDIRPYYAEANYNLGFALSQPGPTQDLPKAIDHYKEAIDLHPNYAEAEYELAVAYYESNDVDNAMAHWLNALRIKPNYEEAYYNLGIAYVQKGMLDEGIAQYKKALEIGPNYAEIYNNIGTAMFQKKDFEQALDNYQKAVGIAPDFLLAKNDLAWLLATCPNPSLRNGKKAVDLIEKDNEQAGGKNPLLLRTLAAAYAESGHYDDAVKAATKALDTLTLNSDPQIAVALKNEIKLYKAGSPYHDTP